MYNYDLQLELRLRNKNMAAQMERDRWERLSEATLPAVKRDWDIRRMASHHKGALGQAVVWLRDGAAHLVQREEQPRERLRQDLVRDQEARAACA